MPRIRITSQHVTSLPAVAGKRTDYRDAIVPGLVLRVSPSGARSWAVRLQQGHGRSRRLITHTIGKASRVSLAKARDEAREVLAHGVPTPGGLTVEVLAGRAIAALELRPKTRVEWERLTRTEIVPGIGAIPATELDRPTVRAWLRTMAQRSRWTADHAFRVLRRYYSWAEEEELIPVSPLHRVKARNILGALPSNDRVLTRDELRRLLGALARLRDAWAYSDATLLLLLTMARRDCVLGLRREELRDLDGKTPLWEIPKERMKAGREHLVPLSPQAVAVVRRRLAVIDAMPRPKGAGPLAHLFPAGGVRTGQDEPMHWPSSWVRELCEEMRPVAEDGTPGPVDLRWTIHGLRRAAATHLREDLGADRYVVRLLLAHAPGDVTGIYDRAELLEERRSALARWGEWLERLREAAPTKAKVLRLRRRA